MAGPYDAIPDEIKQEAAAAVEGGAAKGKSKPASKKKPAEPSSDTSPASGDGGEKPQRRLIKKTRAGVVLSREEVHAIRVGRRKLRKEMRKKGLRSRREFELTAGTLGLYFDKNHGLWFWLWQHWLGTLIAALLAFLVILFVFSLVQQLRGHFTVNLSSGMFKEGFTLADNAAFDNNTTHLFANPAEDVPCISIAQLPTNLDEIDGEHNDLYFAYTYYIRNEGENTVGYTWSLDLNSETQELSNAVWVMLFEDGAMRFYAKANVTTGEKEALPAFGDDTRGYTNLPIMTLDPDSDQFEVIKEVGSITYWRVIPDDFESDTCITTGEQSGVMPNEIHKYTVVMWLEGDDEAANDSAIGGHLGVEMNFRLVSETDSTEEGGDTGSSNENFGDRWKKFWDNIWQGLNS